MEQLQKSNYQRILVERDIPIESLVKTDNGWYFGKYELKYEYITIKLRLSVCPKIIELENYEYEAKPLMIRKMGKKTFQIFYQIRNSNERYKQTNEIKKHSYRIERDEAIVKIKVEIAPDKKWKPKIEHKKGTHVVSREEWSIKHPFQGGAFSPR